MRKKHYLIIFIFLVSAAIALYWLISAGFFPVAIVNGQVVTEREYRKNVAGILNYLTAASKTYGNLNIGDMLKDRDEVRKTALEQIIENRLIHQELSKRLGSDLEAVVLNKMDEVNKNESFTKAATSLYGLSFSDFSDIFLKPVAEREILDGKLFVEKNNFDNWLETAKSQANVVILASNFSWDKKGVVKK